MNLHDLVSQLIIDTKGSAESGFWDFTWDSSLGAFRPEMVICLTILAVLLSRLFRTSRRVDAAWIALAGALLAWVAVRRAGKGGEPAALGAMARFGVRAALIATGDEIDVEHLSLPDAGEPARPSGGSLHADVDALEKQRILEALEAMARIRPMAGDRLAIVASSSEIAMPMVETSRLKIAVIRNESR